MQTKTLQRYSKVQTDELITISDYWTRCVTILRSEHQPYPQPPPFPEHGMIHPSLAKSDSCMQQRV